MGKGRVELPRLAAHDPKSCLSASSSTSPRAAERERVNQLFTPDLLTAFLRSRRDGTSEHTWKFYHTCLKRFLGHELTSQSVNEFLHNLYCRNAKHSYYRAIRALCGWLCKEDYLQDNPTDRVDAPQVTKRLFSTVTLEQLDLLLMSGSDSMSCSAGDTEGTGGDMGSTDSRRSRAGHGAEPAYGLKTSPMAITLRGPRLCEMTIVQGESKTESGAH